MRTSWAGLPSRCNPTHARMSALCRSNRRLAATVPAATDQAAGPGKDAHVHALEMGGPCAADRCHSEHDQRDALVGRCRRVSGHRARRCPGLTEAAAVGVALRHRSDRSPVGPATARGRVATAAPPDSSSESRRRRFRCLQAVILKTAVTPAPRAPAVGLAGLFGRRYAGRYRPAASASGRALETAPQQP